MRRTGFDRLVLVLCIGCLMVAGGSDPVSADAGGGPIIMGGGSGGWGWGCGYCVQTYGFFMPIGDGCESCFCDEAYILCTSCSQSAWGTCYDNYGIAYFVDSCWIDSCGYSN